eukprot:CAMPEP_0206257054 /NCGR_PEP_ID=MMETSP0047_2-20121206/25117_1 /ASSEMBLY_ACC=CAM_ASM_000192 /TAXON_ID=195065 /ORGANISM="Chroomonas mesostigmatica_cf, Strain CCMP1168" /LENGTH=242 /DNA_ID=CAMNT_0053683577 /DNA_START=472 /DNA_END=1197 /DNA_ORIENTATION=+
MNAGEGTASRKHGNTTATSPWCSRMQEAAERHLMQCTTRTSLRCLNRPTKSEMLSLLPGSTGTILVLLVPVAMSLSMISHSCPAATASKHPLHMRRGTVRAPRLHSVPAVRGAECKRSGPSSPRRAPLCSTGTETQGDDRATIRRCPSGSAPRSQAAGLTARVLDDATGPIDDEGHRKSHAYSLKPRQGVKLLLQDESERPGEVDGRVVGLPDPLHLVGPGLELIQVALQPLRASEQAHQLL